MKTNRLTSNIELETAARSCIPYFRGCYMRNTLPNHPLINESGILNLETDKQAGVHWTSWVKKGEKVVYFDSFGNLPPPSEFIRYMKDFKIKYNRQKFQNFSQRNCGALCLQFLYTNS